MYNLIDVKNCELVFYIFDAMFTNTGSFFLSFFLWGYCLEIYCFLSHLFHFTVTWTFDFLLNKYKSIRRHQTSTILITQIHPGHDQLPWVGIEPTTLTSAQRVGGKADLPLSSRPSGPQHWLSKMMPITPMLIVADFFLITIADI